jgi:2-dehydropantoate 2-reductase
LIIQISDRFIYDIRFKIFMDVLIVGAGALGSYLGHVLSRTCNVTLVARGPHAKAVKAQGLVVKEGRRTLKAGPRVVSRPVKGGWDLVMITTKAYDAEKALSSALDVMKEDTALVLFLNGLGLEETALRMLRKRKLENPVVRGLTAHGFALDSPGVVKHTGLGRTTVGGYAGKADVRALADALNAGGMETKVLSDIRKEAWIKTVVNASINPVAATAGVRNGRLLSDTELKEVMMEVCFESARVAAEEVSVTRSTLWKRVVEVATLTSKNRCSMLQDLDKSRPTEIDWINGEIVRRADEYGFPVPVNRTLIAMVKARQAFSRTLPK